jgi:hypothetical protein
MTKFGAKYEDLSTKRFGIQQKIKTAKKGKYKESRFSKYRLSDDTF